MSNTEESVNILINLQGATKAIAEEAEMAAGWRDLGASIEEASVATSHYNRQSFFVRQGLYTLRRLLYLGTIAFAGIGVAAVYSGIKFDAMAQRAIIAFRYLGKGAFNAKDELNKLLDIARNTAFLPTNIINAGQQLLAFGFTASQTNRILQDTGDAIAALNLPQETVNRIILALGQIRVKGRVMGEELRQLANANIPAYTYLANAFGKNVVQIGKIGNTSISAAAGINAILKGLEAQYGGASKAIVKTTSGQWEQLRGDIQVIMGGIVAGGFKKLAGAMQGITKVTGQLQHAIRYNNANFNDLVNIVDKATGGALHLHIIVNSVVDAFKAWFIYISFVLKVFKPFIIAALYFGYVLVEIAKYIADFLNLADPRLTWLLRILAVYFIADTIALKAYALWTGRTVLANKLLLFWTKRLWAQQILIAAVTGIASVAMTVYGAVTTFAAGAMTALATAEWATIAPFIIIGLAVAALVAGLIVLQLKYHGVTKAVEWLWGKMKAFYNWLKGHNLSGALWNAIPGGGLIHSALSLAGHFGTGGTVGQSGNYMVGDKGPEILSLPAGAKIRPASASHMDWSGVSAAGGMNVTIYPADVYIDGRQVAEIVFKHRADRIARA